LSDQSAREKKPADCCSWRAIVLVTFEALRTYVEPLVKPHRAKFSVLLLYSTSTADEGEVRRRDRLVRREAFGEILRGTVVPRLTDAIGARGVRAVDERRLPLRLIEPERVEPTASR
jgi:hypothetical protein